MKGIVLKIKSPKNFHNRKNNITYFIKRYGIFAMFLISILVGFILGIYFGVNTDLEFKKSFDFLFPSDFTSRARFDYLVVFICVLLFLTIFLCLLLILLWQYFYLDFVHGATDLHHLLLCLKVLVWVYP